MIREARRFNVLACGRRWGKTQLGIEQLIRPALSGYPVAYFAPTYRMLTEAWRQVRWLVQPITTRISEQEHRIELVTGGIVEFWSLDQPDAARGRKYKRVVLDEAAMVRRLDEAWQAVIRPTLTDYQGDAWFLSTPKGYGNFFAELFDRGRSPKHPEYISWQMPTLANPYIAPSEVEAARAELPELTFAQEYEALFVSSGGTTFKREWWRGQNRYDSGDGGIHNAAILRLVSFDTAFKDKANADYTGMAAFALLPDYRLALLESTQRRLEFPDLSDAILRESRRFNRRETLRYVLIEDTGAGTSALQTLRASSERWLVPLLVGRPATTSKVERALQASVWCRNGSILLPHPSAAAPWLADFEDQLFTFPSGVHDDMVDAFTMAINYLEHYLAEGYHARNG